MKTKKRLQATQARWTFSPTKIAKAFTFAMGENVAAFLWLNENFAAINFDGHDGNRNGWKRLAEVRTPKPETGCGVTDEMLLSATMFSSGIDLPLPVLKNAVMNESPLKVVGSFSPDGKIMDVTFIHYRRADLEQHQGQSSWTVEATK